MKKLLLCSTLLFFSTILAVCQTREITSLSTTDYSQFFVSNKIQTWKLTGIASNDYYTAVFLRINVESNAEGSFTIPKEASISGPFGTMYPIGVSIADKDWTLGKYYAYSKGNKGKGDNVTIYFNRIPTGVSNVSFSIPNWFFWENITVDNNPDQVSHSNWTEQSLREHWSSNKINKIEGIYFFANTSDKQWWGTNKHTLAIIKEGYQYNIVYLKGSNKNVWKEGDIKATFIPTAVPKLYKVTSWYMENRVNYPEMGIKFTDGFMTIYDCVSNTSADFLKIFPSKDLNN